MLDKVSVNKFLTCCLTGKLAYCCVVKYKVTVKEVTNEVVEHRETCAGNVVGKKVNDDTDDDINTCTVVSAVINYGLDSTGSKSFNNSTYLCPVFLELGGNYCILINGCVPIHEHICEHLDEVVGHDGTYKSDEGLSRTTCEVCEGCICSAATLNVSCSARISCCAVKCKGTEVKELSCNDFFTCIGCCAFYKTGDELIEGLLKVENFVKKCFDIKLKCSLKNRVNNVENLKNGSYEVLDSLSKVVSLNECAGIVFLCGIVRIHKICNVRNLREKNGERTFEKTEAISCIVTYKESSESCKER